TRNIERYPALARPAGCDFHFGGHSQQEIGLKRRLDPVVLQTEIRRHGLAYAAAKRRRREAGPDVKKGVLVARVHLAHGDLFGVERLINYIEVAEFFAADGREKTTGLPVVGRKQ